MKLLGVQGGSSLGVNIGQNPRRILSNPFLGLRAIPGRERFAEEASVPRSVVMSWIMDLKIDFALYSYLWLS